MLYKKVTRRWVCRWWLKYHVVGAGSFLGLQTGFSLVFTDTIQHRPCVSSSPMLNPSVIQPFHMYFTLSACYLHQSHYLCQTNKWLTPLSCLGLPSIFISLVFSHFPLHSMVISELIMTVDWSRLGYPQSRLFSFVGLVHVPLHLQTFSHAFSLCYEPLLICNKVFSFPSKFSLVLDIW